MSQNLLLEALLKQAASQKVSNAFDLFLDKKINISMKMRERASASQKAIRDYLDSKYQTDKTFPRVLSKVSDDFIGGSFGRHTKTKPLDDIDIYFPLDGFGLIYVQGNSRLPYTVLSDSAMTVNPLLGTLWMDGNYISSRKLIDGFCRALADSKYWKTEIRKEGQAVNVQTTIGQTEDSDGLAYDIVPCFLLKPYSLWEDDFYLIPNGNNGWIRTNPKKDERITERLQVNNNKTFRKVVKLIKYWNQEYLSGDIKSYFIELAIAKRYGQLNESKVYVKTVSYGLLQGFGALLSALQCGSIASWLANAPLVLSDASTSSIVHISTALTFSGNAFRFEESGNADDALKSWSGVFRDDFLP